MGPALGLSLRARPPRAPGGVAELAAEVKARGFLPNKHYEMDRYSPRNQPDPLPPGHDKVPLGFTSLSEVPPT